MEVPEEHSKETVFLRIFLVSLKESKMQERSRGKKCGQAKKGSVKEILARCSSCLGITEVIKHVKLQKCGA